MKWLGLIVFLLGLYLAFFSHSIYWYSFYLIGGFIFLDAINLKHGFSVLKNPKAFIKTWLIFIFLTVIVELIGNYWLNGWDSYFTLAGYIFHGIIIGYPFAAFLAMEYFVAVKRYFKGSAISLIIAAIVYGYLHEIPNLFAYAWKYTAMPLGSFFGVPILISLLWLSILFVLYFEKPFWTSK